MARFTFSVEEGIATLLLSNPPQNRLNSATSADFRAAVETVQADHTIRALVIRAEGDNFSFGGDISNWLDVDPAAIGAGIGEGLQQLRAFEELRVPVISAVQGICLGGAFEIVLRTDIIVAAEDARFGHSEQTLGLITLMGGVQRVAERAGRARALRWAMTAERVPAREMLEAGVITEIVPNGQLVEAAYNWARRLGKGATLAHAAHKKMMNAWSNGGIAAADALIPELAEQLWQTEDAHKGIASAQDALRRGVERPILEFDGR
ncbi:MAG: enoyl-CoA hydratase/isomerase family protein [Parvibaculaceae bacterium]|nr:enoyl-CoA hydratase/isomerase family protein [Parvibaculaceae bacterium]